MLAGQGSALNTCLIISPVAVFTVDVNIKLLLLGRVGGKAALSCGCRKCPRAARLQSSDLVLPSAAVDSPRPHASQKAAAEVHEGKRHKAAASGRNE